MLLQLEHSVRRLFDWFEDIKGVRVVIKLHSDKHPGDSFQVSTNAGFSFNIHCRLHKYQKRHARWFLPDKKINIYQVFCVCDENTPAELKERLEKEHYVPETVSRITTENFRKKSAVNSFLSILITELAIDRQTH